MSAASTRKLTITVSTTPRSSSTESDDKDILHNVVPAGSELGDSNDLEDVLEGGSSGGKHPQDTGNILNRSIKGEIGGSQVDDSGASESAEPKSCDSNAFQLLGPFFDLDLSRVHPISAKLQRLEDFIDIG